MKITIFVDNEESWIVPYVLKLKRRFKALGHAVIYLNDSSKIASGDLAFFLSCEKIIPLKILRLNKHNLVIHESGLPKGKGWSPLTWQILEGKNSVPITLFEADEKVDNGQIYLQETMQFLGDELLDELRNVQGNKTIELAVKFVKKYPTNRSKAQVGEETFYRRRGPKDSELDVNKTIAEQFNLLRIVDNKRYPAFFKYKGKKYNLRVTKSK